MVRRNEDDNDYGQVDGDAGPGLSPFATSMSAQPWLRTGQPPWHLWGGSDTQRISVVAFDPDISVTTVQLAKVAYKRPESWKFILAMKLLAGQTAPVGNGLTVNVLFDLVVGIGRAMTTLPAFATLTLTYSNGAVAPVNQVLMTDSGVGISSLVNGVLTTRDVDNVVAQDIQCNARIVAGASFSTAFSVEVSAFFAPIAHVRPDWFLGEPFPLEAQFPGAETAGK